jgi:hypothetical protein
MSAAEMKRVWFYYANKRQVGPIPLSDLKDAIGSGRVSAEDYVFREGFQDWKLLKDVPELAQGAASIPRPPRLQDGRKSPLKRGTDRRQSDRVPLDELVIAHNDENLASGTLTDISVSGVFFVTQNPCFSLNNEVKLTLKEGKGLGKPMNLRGTVVRQIQENDRLVGYGIELQHLDIQTRNFISNYIKRNKAS